MSTVDNLSVLSYYRVMEQQIAVGTMVRIQGQTEWPSLNGSTAKVMMVFHEPNAYTGEPVTLYEVLANGRHHRLQGHELEVV